MPEPTPLNPPALGSGHGTSGGAPCADSSRHRRSVASWLLNAAREARWFAADYSELGREALTAWLHRRQGYPRLRAMFNARVGYWPDLESPRSLEKIQWRKIHDRNPLYPVILDKVRVRDDVAGLLGRAAAARLFPRLLGVTSKPTGGWLRSFGTGIDVKVNHSSGQNAFVYPGTDPDFESLARRAKHWLRRPHGVVTRQWGYWEIARRILVEELLLARTPEGVSQS